MAREAVKNQASKPMPSGREQRLRVLLCVRYLLPLFSALLVLLMGAFYNVYAVQGGRAVQFSVLRLCFNTLKSARAYMMGSEVVAGVRNFYLVLIIGAACFMLFFLVSVALSCFAAYSLYRVWRARACEDRAEEKNAKVLFRAVLPNRALMSISNALLLPFAFFPEFFTFVCGRFLTVSGTTAVFVRFNVTSVVATVLFLFTVVLAVYLQYHERAVGLDLFFIEEELATDQEPTEVPDSTDA